MFWEGGQWNVALSGAVDGQVRLLATMTFDEWIGLSATQEACDVINTDLEDGVLTLTLPKAKHAQPRKITIG
jgi:HSP20 family molecular chaperone IbpA